MSLSSFRQFDRFLLPVSAMPICVLGVMLSVSSVAAQPGSGGLRVIEPTLPQTNSFWGTALLAGQRITGVQNDDLYVGAPSYDTNTNENAGMWRRWVFGSRQAIPSTVFFGSAADWNAGATLALAVSSDGDGRLLSGEPGAPVGGVAGSGRVAVLGKDAPLFGPNIGQNTPLPLDPPEIDDHFGWALAVGDFDDDGYEDFAASAPFDDRIYNAMEPPVKGRGVVHVYYGGANDTDFTSGHTLLSPSTIQQFSLFGFALASGDFNGDGYDDLAVGEPQAKVNGTQTGAVQVFYGSSTGLQSTPQTLVPDQFNLPATTGLSFGYALAAGDFDRTFFCALGPCQDDLAIGAPGYVEPSSRGVIDGSEEGALVVSNGSPTGLTPSVDSPIRQDDLVADAVSSVEGNERFGGHLWAGRFDGRIGDDLAVGVPFDRSGIEAEGILHLVYGGDSGLGSHPGHLLSWERITGQPPDSRDHFGGGFAAGDFDADGHTDLAISATWKASGGQLRAGKVAVLFGGCLFCDGFEDGSTSNWQ